MDPLEPYFQAARDASLEPSPALMNRVLRDAYALRPLPAPLPWWRRAWVGVAGMAVGGIAVSATVLLAVFLPDNAAVASYLLTMEASLSAADLVLALVEEG